MIRHQVRFEVFAYLSEHGQSDCGFCHLEMTKYNYECCDVGTLYFDNEIFRCGKIYYSNSIIITNFAQTFIPSRRFKNMVFTEFIAYTFQFHIEAGFHIINFILCSGMNIQNNNMKPATSQYYV
jgi:hypothetical protein